MRDIILNEKACAERLLRNNETLEDVKATLSLLARYGAQVLDLSPAQSRQMLREFSDRNYRDVSLHYLNGKITYYTENAAEIPLAAIDFVPITQEELDAVAALDGLNAQCAAFAALALVKFDMMKCPEVNFWLRSDRFGEIIRRANVSMSAKELDYIFGALRAAGMVELPKRVDNCNLHILYASPMDAPDVALELRDQDFKDLGYVLRAYWGEPFVRCQECGRWIRQAKNGRRKFCDDCAADNHRRQNSDAMQRRRA